MKILYISLKDLKILIKDIKTVLFAVCLPIILVIILGFSLNSIFPTDEKVDISKIALVNKDNEDVSRVFTDELISNSSFTDYFQMDEEQAVKKLSDKEINAIVIIPPGFSKGILNEAPQKIQLVVGENGGIMSAAIATQMISLSGKFSKDFARVAVFTNTESKNALAVTGKDFEADKARYSFNEIVEKKDIEIPRKKGISSIAYYSVAMLVMSMFTLAFTQSRTIIEEKEDKMTFRIMAAGISKSGIIAGRLLSLVIICLAQAGILILATAFILGVNWGNNIFLLLMITGSMVISICGITVFFTGIFMKSSTVTAFSGMFTQVSALIGGGYIPLHLMPKGLNIAAMGTVNWWSYKTYENLMLYNNVSEITTNCIILSGIGCLFLLLGISGLNRISR